MFCWIAAREIKDFTFILIVETFFWLTVITSWYILTIICFFLYVRTYCEALVEFTSQNLAKSYKTTEKCYISENTHFCTAHILNKIVLKWANYPIKTKKSRIGWCLEFTSKYWLVLQNHKKVLYLWKYTFLVNKMVLEWAIYAIKPIKIRFEHSLFST